MENKRSYLWDGLIVVAFLCGIAWLFGACAAIPLPKPDDNKNYSRQLSMEVNKQKGIGMMVVPAAPKYDIKVTFDGDIDFLLVRSCNREDFFEKEGGDFKYTYVPIVGLETGRVCPLIFNVVEKGKDRRPAGWIDFTDAFTTLPATLKCNGVVTRYPSASACQSGAGLAQRIEFDVPAKVDNGKVEGDTSCPVPVASADKKVFDWRIATGSCTFTFMELGDKQRFHRLTSYGYDEIRPSAN